MSTRYRALKSSRIRLKKCWAVEPGGSLEMASYVPPDRFFVYVGKPESISALLDTGAPFIASMGTALTGNCLQYNLESRYLARLGMTRDWVDAVLTSGLTSEMALFTPDLFFIDGTDVTIVARLRQPQLLRQLLGLLGASKLDTESVLELPTASGDPAYLALRDDLLFASTNRGELQQSIDLLEQQGEGSLGASTEFRYMLTTVTGQRGDASLCVFLRSVRAKAGGASSQNRTTTAGARESEDGSADGARDAGSIGRSCQA